MSLKISLELKEKKQIIVYNFKAYEKKILDYVFFNRI